MAVRCAILLGMPPTSTVPPVLSVRDLEVRYGRGKRAFRALRGITLEVGRGHVFGLLGPNGAGKTTLVKTLLGLVKPWKGDARMFGLPVGHSPTRSRVGYLPEAHRLPGYLTGRQVVELFGMLCGRDRAYVRKRANELLERVDMTKSADRKISEYSKGMQQRIGLVQALVHDPELLFLDEPTDGIDPVGRRAIRAMIAELKEKGVTVFINSHLLLEIEMMCDRVVIMNGGVILRDGTLDELTPSTGTLTVELRETVPPDLEKVLQGVGRELRKSERAFELHVARNVIDAVIDRLRARGLGIRSLQPRRLTLEEFFIDLVDRKPEPAGATGAPANDGGWSS